MRCYSICSSDVRSDSSSTLFRDNIPEVFEVIQMYRSKYPTDRIHVSFYDSITQSHGKLLTICSSLKLRKKC